ncbi:hypothetical protein NCS52_00994400 [Fusarium sp. LHS14.1]|nr:hypothetical protein NCS52_00994400 [Fusarium sp. LHS14.1]
MPSPLSTPRKALLKLKFDILELDQTYCTQSEQCDAMRSRDKTFVTIPFPNDVPPHVVVEYVQTYEPVLQHNPGVVSYDPVDIDPAQFATDPWLDLCEFDSSLRLFQAHEIIWLAPGVQKNLSWLILFQRVPDGIVCRCKAGVGVVSWTEWSVRPRQREESSPSTPSTATPSSQDGDDGWELQGIVTVEANRLLLPSCMWIAKWLQKQIGQSMVNEACVKHVTAHKS